MMLLLLSALSCSGDSEPADASSNVESTEHVRTVVQRDLPLVVMNFHQERDSLKTKSIVDAISAGQVAFSDFKGRTISPGSAKVTLRKGSFYMLRMRHLRSVWSLVFINCLWNKYPLVKSSRCL